MSPDRPLRHKKLYLPGGDVILRVDNYLCRVHSYFFTRESAYFRDLLLHQSSFGDQVKQSSDDNPIWLDDCTVDEFSYLCWIFYNPKHDVYAATVDQWATILRVSDLWGFAEITALVFRELEKLDVDPAMRIHLYQKHRIPSDLLHNAFEALATRPEPLTEEEGRLLGINTFARVVHARELARSRDGGETPSPLTVSQDELRAILARLRLSPLHAHTNGGLNTDVPRANGPQSAPLLMHRSNSGDYSSKAGSMTVPATPLETIHESPSQSPSLMMGDLPPSYDRTTGGRSVTGGPGKISIPPWNVKVYGKQRWT